MNAQEYKEYEESVQAFFDREGLSNLSTDMDHYEEGCIEPHFSWSPCHCCGSHLGGDREHMNGYNTTTKEVQDGYVVCADCVYYVEYGRLDDMTMLEVEG